MVYKIIYENAVFHEIVDIKYIKKYLLIFLIKYTNTKDVNHI